MAIIKYCGKNTIIRKMKYSKVIIGDRWITIDNRDVDRVKIYKWYIGNGYAVSSDRRLKSKQMHKLILGVDLDNDLVVDHINRNKLDNRRKNLRVATPSINSWNKAGTKGYFKNNRNKKWEACIGKNRKTIKLGSFNTEGEAMTARAEAEKKYYSKEAIQKELRE